MTHNGNGGNTIYHPLADSEVRLMRMSHDDGSVMQCELGIFHIDRMPSYKALSYCWTHEDPVNSISLHQQQVMVRPNLYAYLEIMHQERHDCWIFIDALCINQDDLAERGQQVQLMGRTYRCAEEVVAWLGMAADGGWNDELNERAARSLPLLERICASKKKLAFFLEKESEKEKSTSKQSALLSVLLIIFSRSEYWCRAWIVQETMLARSLLIRFRSLRIQSDTLLLLFEKVMPLRHPRGSWDRFVGEYSPNGYAALLTSRPPDVMPRAQWILHLQHRAFKLLKLGESIRNDQHNLHRMTLLSAVINFSCTQQCAMDFDRVFAVLGLCNSRLQPSYAMSKFELYFRVFVEGILEHDLHEALRPGGQPTDSSLTVERPNVEWFCVHLLQSLGLSIAQPITSLATSMALEFCGKQGELYEYALHAKHQTFLMVQEIFTGLPWSGLSRSSRKIMISRRLWPQRSVLLKQNKWTIAIYRKRCARALPEWAARFHEILNEETFNRATILKDYIRRRLDIVKKQLHEFQQPSVKIDDQNMVILAIQEMREIIEQCTEGLSNPNCEVATLVQVARSLSGVLGKNEELRKKLQKYTHERNQKMAERRSSGEMIIFDGCREEPTARENRQLRIENHLSGQMIIFAGCR